MTLKPTVHRCSRFALFLAIPFVIALAPVGNAATKIWNTTSGSLSAGSSWSATGTPATTDETLFDGTITPAASINTAAGTNLSFGNLIWNNNTSSTIQMNTTGVTSTQLRLTGGGGSTAAIANGGASGDLLVMGTNATTNTLTFSDVNLLGGVSLRLRLDTSGNFNVVNSGAILNIQTIISESTGGAKTLTKTGAGQLTLGSANTFTGGVVLSSGTLGLGSSSALGSGALALNGGRLASSVSARNISNVVTVGGNFTLGGLGNSITLNGTMDLGGASRTITLDNSATIGGVISSGGLGLSSTTAGRTLTLTGTNDYTGTTQVSSGTLLVNGNQSAATGAVSIAAGAILGGGGTVGGATGFTGASVHAPGSAAATVGIQSFSSTVTYGIGTTFSWDLNTLTGGDVTDPGPGVSNAGTGTYDQVAATGAITGGSAVFRVVLAAGDSFGDAFWNTDKSWTNIFTGGAGTAANLAALFSGFDASGGVDAAGAVTGRGQFALSSAANTLSWTAVPEPSSALAGLLIAAGLVRRRRI